MARPGVICGLSLLLVLVLAPRVFLVPFFVFTELKKNMTEDNVLF